MRVWVWFFYSLALVSAGFGQSEAEAFLKGEADWSRLDTFQGKVSRDTFEEALQNVYAPDGHWKKWIRIDETEAVIRTDVDREDAVFRLRFGKGESIDSKRAGILAGLKIALDAGHLGGEWAELEERSFAMEGMPPVREGDLTLATAQRLERLLRRAGADVFMIRSDAEPATHFRPGDFMAEARRRLGEDAARDELDKLANRLFVRTAEIRGRAERLHARFDADLVVALHINATNWPDPEHPSLVDRNDYHLIVSGCFMEGEIADDNQRLEMLLRLLSGYHEEEISLAKSMKKAGNAALGLPPYRYEGKNALAMDEDGYIWARNLLANRLYDCPVVYLEPWIANSKEVYPWAAEGDYEGVRRIGDRWRQSLPSLYAEFAFAGLLDRYGE